MRTTITTLALMLSVSPLSAQRAGTSSPFSRQLQSLTVPTPARVYFSGGRAASGSMTAAMDTIAVATKGGPLLVAAAEVDSMWIRTSDNEYAPAGAAMGTFSGAAAGLLVALVSNHFMSVPCTGGACAATHEPLSPTRLLVGAGAGAVIGFTAGSIWGKAQMTWKRIR